jgi:methionyl-tRNA formyltransferase
MGGEPLRVVFMGTPEFAVPSLLCLAEHHDVVAVFTRPDAVSGRGGQTRPSPVKTVALRLGMPVCQAATLRDAEQIELLCSYAPDIVVVAAYGLILPAAALEAAPLGAVNVHASLLPRWRGAAPIQRAILAGDELTGVSIMRMEVGLDTGPYCLQLQTPIADKDATMLTSELAEMGATALLSVLPTIADGTATWIAQDESQVTYADKVSKTDVAIAPELTAADVVRRVRASLPTAPTRAMLGGRGATILAAEAATGADLAPGSIAPTKSALLLGVADGGVRVTRLKPDGKAAMDATAWARGARDLDGASWTAAL